MEEGDIFYLCLGTPGVDQPLQWGRVIATKQILEKLDIEDLMAKNMIRKVFLTEKNV